jgi:hypothetical protein
MVVADGWITVAGAKEGYVEKSGVIVVVKLSKPLQLNPFCALASTSTSMLYWPASHVLTMTMLSIETVSPGLRLVSFKLPMRDSGMPLMYSVNALISIEISPVLDIMNVNIVSFSHVFPSHDSTIMAPNLSSRLSGV